MRELTAHLINPVNDKLTITVEDKPGAGGAHHRYKIAGFDSMSNPSRADGEGFLKPDDRFWLLFQNGPIAERGTNGITHEALLAVLIDRLQCFQAGDYRNDYNRQAMHHLECALDWLKQRTLDRMARGVEGQNKV